MDLKSIPGYSKVNLGAGRLCTSALVWEDGQRGRLSPDEQRDANVALRWWLAFWGASVKKKSPSGQIVRRLLSGSRKTGSNPDFYFNAAFRSYGKNGERKD